ncbi:hypothetical protein VTO42DRAFT_6167 [Malbranchea cinnamomea]
MVLELHIWGPAFGLPSLDPQCLAAIAYFAFALPSKSSSTQGATGREDWVLIASSDPLAVPTHELPAVRAGTRWVSGFRNIVEFLKQYSNGEWDLDRWMNHNERADCIAFSSFIESHGQPLIDLSFYVSSENYRKATMSAYAPILRWPNQWIVPPKIRSVAKTRTEHLGLSSLDVDATEEERRQAREANTAAAQIPKSLATRPRETVSSALSKTAQQNRIRLEGMTGAFAEPLEELRSHKRYLLSEEFPSSLDCLALGYLSLAVIPELPYPWLRDGIKSQTPGLVGYTERLRSQCFGGTVDVATALSDPSTTPDSQPHSSTGLRHHHELPWQPPERLNLAGIGKRIWDVLLDSIPVVRDVRTSRRLQKAGEEIPEGVERDLVIQVARAQRYNSYLSIGTVVGGLGLLVWYTLTAGVLSMEYEDEEEEEEEEAVQEQSTPSPWGEAGAILDI